MLSINWNWCICAHTNIHFEDKNCCTYMRRDGHKNTIRWPMISISFWIIENIYILYEHGSNSLECRNTFHRIYCILGWCKWNPTTFSQNSTTTKNHKMSESTTWGEKIAEVIVRAFWQILENSRDRWDPENILDVFIGCVTLSTFAVICFVHILSVVRNVMGCCAMCKTAQLIECAKIHI